MEEREDKTPSAEADDADTHGSAPTKKSAKQPPREIGGPEGPEPTRYGDWERNGRVSDF